MSFDLQWDFKENYPNILVLTLNGEVFQEVLSSFFQKGLKKREVFSSKEEALDWFFSLEMKLAKKYVLYLLSKIDYPTDFLREKLKKKMVSKKTTDVLLLDIEKKGFVDDSAWLERFIEKEFLRGHGPRLILAKLQAKRMDKASVQAAIARLVPDDRQVEKIQEMKHKISSFPKNKLMVFFLRRGFDSYCIQKGIKE